MNDLDYMMSEEKLYNKYGSLKIQELENTYWQLIIETEGEITTEIEYIENIIKNKREDYLKYAIGKIYELNGVLNAKKEHKKSLEEQLKSIQNQIDKTQEWVNITMNNLHLDKYDCEVGKISYRKSTSVNITDIDILDDNYIDIVETAKPRKAEIKKAIQAGYAIAGAELVTSKNLNIK